VDVFVAALMNFCLVDINLKLTNRWGVAGKPIAIARYAVAAECRDIHIGRLLSGG